MTLGKRVTVLYEGRIEQVDAPARLYNQPATTFVAQFIGSPPMNLIEPNRLTSEAASRCRPVQRSSGFGPTTCD